MHGEAIRQAGTTYERSPCGRVPGDSRAGSSGCSGPDHSGRLYSAGRRPCIPNRLPNYAEVKPERDAVEG